MEVVGAISDVTQITEQEKLAKSLVYLFEDKNAILNLINWSISKEVEAPDVTEGTMFRQNSLATKLFSHYAKLVSLPYLWHTLALIIHELNDMSQKSRQSAYITDQKSILSSANIELDPTKMSEDDDTDINALECRLLVQKIFKAITNSTNNPHLPQ